ARRRARSSRSLRRDDIGVVRLAAVDDLDLAAACRTEQLARRVRILRARAEIERAELGATHRARGERERVLRRRRGADGLAVDEREVIAVAHADAVDVGVADGARHLDGACTARGLLHRTRDRLEIAL